MKKTLLIFGVAAAVAFAASCNQNGGNASQAAPAQDSTAVAGSIVFFNMDKVLEGYDMVWKNADKSRIAHYQGLPSGRYIFKVRAFLLESPERADTKELVIIVPPHFFMSSNAIWLYMALAAIIALWFMFWRQKKIKKAYGVTKSSGGKGLSSIFRRKKEEEEEKKEDETDTYEIIE